MKLWQQQPYVRISVTYLLVAGLWIVLSDRLLRLLFSGPTLATLQNHEVWLFTVLSVAVVAMLLRRESRLTASARRAEPAGAGGRPAGLPFLSPDKNTPILETIPEGFVATDLQYRIVRVNTEAEQILGRKRQDLTGRKLWEIFPEAGPSSLYQQCVRVVSEQVSVRFVEYHAGLQLLLDVRAYPSGEGLSIYFRPVDERGDVEASLRFHAQLLESVTSAVVAVDRDGRITYWNHAATRLFGWSAAVVMGESLIDVIARERSAGEGVLQRLFAGERWAGELRLKERSGVEFAGYLSCAPLWDAFGKASGAVGVVENVTARKEAEETLREQERLFRLIAEHATDLILLFTAEGVLHYASPSSQQRLGYTPEELTGGTFELLLAMVHPEDREPFRKALEEVRLTHRAVSVTHRLQSRHGEYLYMESSIRVVMDPRAQSVRYQTISRDITCRAKCEEQLAHQMLHDPVTGLPNRTFFIRRLEERMAGSTGRSLRYAVLFLDLDNFKLINDTLGHGRGDELLVAVGIRVRDSLSAEAIVARLGGDEFAVLIPGIVESTEAIEAAEQLLSLLQEPFLLGENEVFVTASVGVVVSLPGHLTTDDLLRDADVAMYRAKQKGKNQYELFSPSMKERLVARLQMETDLRRAIERDELMVFYQPVVLVDSGRIAGLEALVRWNHPQRGVISPGDFIPLAEETGLILPIGRWVLREACHQVRRWQVNYEGYRDLVLSVNLSARQLSEPRLVEEVASALRDSELNPAHLTLEITESVLMQDVVTTTQALRQLKGLGVRLAIDDFGTGYSSLSYLKRFAVDTLKVDRSFVERLGQDCQDSAIVGTVISLAKTLNLSVTGEGIETAEQLAELRALGCDQGQGFYFTRPLPVDQAQDILARQPGW